MRLQPIENPRNLLARFAYWVSRQKFGKVMMPLKVVYARNAGLMWPSYQIEKTIEGRLSLDATLTTLIKVYLSMLNGCAFCKDIGLAQAVRKRLGSEKFRDLERFRESAAFTDLEKAALAFVEEANARTVTDSTFADLRHYFSEAEIVEITWVQAAEAYYNAISIPLGIESDGLHEMAERQRSGVKYCAPGWWRCRTNRFNGRCA